MPRRETRVAPLARLGRSRRACGYLGIVVFMHLASGCFSAHMRPPPKAIEEPTARVECTSSPVPPVLDGVCAVALGALAGVLVREAINAPPCDGMGPCFSPAAEWTGAVLVGAPAVLCGISAVGGARKASRCAEVKRANTACIDGDAAACERLKSGRLAP